METQTKVIIGTSIVVVGALIGWAIYSSTQNAVEEGKSDGETSESGSPKEGITKDVIKPGGLVERTYPDGTRKMLTPVQVKEEVKKAISGRGADGSVSWRNCHGHMA